MASKLQKSVVFNKRDQHWRFAGADFPGIML
jgi:hypothetical protein